MLITDSTFVCSNPFSCLISSRYGSKPSPISPTFAKKKDFSEISSTENHKPIFPQKLGSSKILVQSAIGLFALGFIDAGYSGDWSRIGVISKGTEDLLKYAAILVVPLCIFLIFSLINKVEE